MVPYLKDPQAIYEKSFAIVREQAALDGVAEDLREVAIRVIHACGMPDIVDAIDASPTSPRSAVSAFGPGRHCCAIARWWQAASRDAS